MYLAFASIAIAVASLIHCLRYELRADSRLRTLLSGLLGTSSFFFALAGAVTLEDQTTIHIGSVFISFMALATALFIIFRQAPSCTLRLLSGAALLFSLVALALSNLAYLELGTAQRLMAFSMVGWIAGAGAYFTLKNKPVKTI